MQPRPVIVVVVFFLATGFAPAQQVNPDNLRSSPKVLKAFQAVVARPSESTVRVQSNGKDVALGTIVDAAGWILTKASDLRENVTCRLNDGRTMAAQVVGVEEAYDLALLKVDVKGLPAIEWRPSKEARVGQWVASPGPAADPVAVGVVSVGTRKFVFGDQPPKNRGAKSGYLGVQLAETEGGARIAWLEPNSPADRAGLKVGDVVTHAGGMKILDNESLINIIQGHHPGERVALKIQRGDETLALKATLAPLPKKMQGNPQDRMGSTLSDRRGGFPLILQHDTVLRPVDCGGPLVDLDGKAVGVNIARAGRTESYAIPSEAVLALLPDLKSGKRAPTVEVSGPNSPAPRGSDANVLLRDVNRLAAQDPAPAGRPGCHSRLYGLKLAAGDHVTIDLESLDFDAFLRLEDNAGKKLAEDDNGGLGFNARLAFRAPREDTYHIVVTSFAPEETGSYELTVRKTGGQPTKK